jgi:hypothetical protein
MHARTHRILTIIEWCRLFYERGLPNLGPIDRLAGHVLSSPSGNPDPLWWQISKGEKGLLEARPPSKLRRHVNQAGCARNVKKGAMRSLSLAVGRLLCDPGWIDWGIDADLKYRRRPGSERPFMLLSLVPSPRVMAMEVPV